MSEFSNEEINTLIPEFDKYKDKKMANALRELLAYREAAKEPVAYITYKGYLIHAGDPKLSHYSEPEPLYAAPQLP